MAADSSSAADQDQDADLDPWDPAKWSGSIPELKQRMKGMSIPHDLKCEIHLILDKADPARYTELLAFLVNTVSALSLEERTALLSTRLDTQDSPAARRMMQKYQISLAVLRQWQQSAAEAAQEELDNEEVMPPEAELDSDADYIPSGTSSQESSQETWTAAPKYFKSKQSVQKRPHTLTPMEGEQIRLLAKAKQDSQSHTPQPTPMEEDEVETVNEAVMMNRANWSQLWQQLGNTWPSSAKSEFPLATGSTTQWVAAAKGEPAKLVRLLQRFPFPDELLTAVAEPVLQQWTAAWRRECLHGQLGIYVTRCKDKATQQWIEDWRTRIARPRAKNLDEASDNTVDWIRLRGNGYGKDEILKLCDTANKLRLAQHILCSLLYEKAIKVLTHQEDVDEQGVRSRLARHLAALQEADSFRKAFTPDGVNVNWTRTARYFATEIEHGGPDPTIQYDQ